MGYVWAPTRTDAVTNVTQHIPSQTLPPALLTYYPHLHPHPSPLGT